jgi:hypothetical protein
MIPELGSPKDPHAKRDYSYDWTADLADDEVLVTSTWEVFPADFGDSPLVVLGSEIDESEKVARVYLDGGDPGKFFQVTNVVTTNLTPTEDRQSFILFIQER